MNYRIAAVTDCSQLGRLNHQLIQDEGHRNSMTVAQLEERMRDWMTSGEYRAVLFEEESATVAWALFRETETEVHLRQFFVVRERRREGIGRRAIGGLLVGVWPANKRLTVSVLVTNVPAVAFWRSVGYTDYDLTLEMLPSARVAVRG
jgi:predicted acetyltransferase